MSKIKITAVSYLNTKPFLYGINKKLNPESIDVILESPSLCALAALNNQTNIALVPIAVVPKLKEYKIITDFCIASNGNVGSVILFSDCPISEIQQIHLDYQSKTSVALTKILAKEKWKINPEWIDATPGFETKISGTTAAVVIGDRTFNMKGHYKKETDLANEWKILTGLPMVFAVWVANNNLSIEFTNAFNDALKFGVDHASIVAHQIKDECGIDVSKYFSDYIKYDLKTAEKNSMALFFSKIGGE